MNRREPGSLQIYEVESADDLGGVCLVRCIGGVVHTGQVFLLRDADGGPTPESGVTLTRIERYGRSVDVLDPPHTARLTLTGRGVPALGRGSVISSTS